MIDIITPYSTTVLVVGLTAVLMLVQLIVADVIGIKLGHVPGHPVEPDHGSLFFRANRAFSNSNESVSIFMLATVFAILAMANPFWVNLGAVVYLVGRVAHMACYYLKIPLLRSISFGVSIIGILDIIVVGLVGWFSL